MSQPISAQRFFIVGGAGFIGSHFCDHLLGPAGAAGVTLYDNFSSGRPWHHAQHDADPRFRVVRGEVEDPRALAAAMDGHDVVIHLASNPDIARAAREPTIDFTQGTALTSAVVEAMRTTSAKRILYASGSGVYGELGTREGTEDMGPLSPSRPTAPASWPARRSSPATPTCSGSRLRLPVRQRGRPAPDPRRGLRLRAPAAGRRGAGDDPITLHILGDGTQSKSYVLVSDIVRAVLTAHDQTTAPFAAYNVATGDYITVAEIAALAVECVGLPRSASSSSTRGGDRGWKGDVPIVRLDTARIRGLGWRCEHSSREALRRSMLAMIPDMKAGRM